MELLDSITGSDLAQKLHKRKLEENKKSKKASKEKAEGHCSVHELFTAFYGHPTFKEVFLKTFRSQSALNSALLHESSVGHIARSGKSTKTGVSEKKSEVFGLGHTGNTQVFKENYFHSGQAQQFIQASMVKTVDEEDAKQAASKKKRLSYTSPEPLQALRNVVFGRYNLIYAGIRKQWMEEAKLPAKERTVSLSFEKGTEVLDENGNIKDGKIHELVSQRAAKEGGDVHFLTDGDIVLLRNLVWFIHEEQKALSKGKAKAKPSTDKDERIIAFTAQWKKFQAKAAKSDEYQIGIKALFRHDKEKADEFLGCSYSPETFRSLGAKVKKAWKKSKG